MAGSFFDQLMRVFSSEPRPTGNADVDEVRLYNYQCQPCSLCGEKPAHLHGETYHCDPCCMKIARSAYDQAEGAKLS